MTGAGHCCLSKTAHPRKNATLERERAVAQGIWRGFTHNGALSSTPGGSCGAASGKSNSQSSSDRSPPVRRCFPGVPRELNRQASA